MFILKKMLFCCWACDFRGVKVSQCKVRTINMWGGTSNRHSMAYLLSNICTKNYWNRTTPTVVEIIVGDRVVSFLRHSVRYKRTNWCKPIVKQQHEIVSLRKFRYVSPSECQTQQSRIHKYISCCLTVGLIHNTKTSYHVSRTMNLGAGKRDVNLKSARIHIIIIIIVIIHFTHGNTHLAIQKIW